MNQKPSTHWLFCRIVFLVLGLLLELLCIYILWVEFLGPGELMELQPLVMIGLLRMLPLTPHRHSCGSLQGFSGCGPVCVSMWPDIAGSLSVPLHVAWLLHSHFSMCSMGPIDVALAGGAICGGSCL